WLMMSLWDALRMNMMISYQELVRTFLSLCKRMPQTAVKVLFLIPTPFQAHSCTERRLRNE
ncbi:hypothetical protein, partial [Klebsiella pneumoniae]|uniref:hypothetical protein n=1 Tax=Klebsiella pneumoniae TaxID=573 RepID=UPI001C836E9D